MLPKINLLQSTYNLNLKITSGFRTWAHHKEIYKAINDQRIIAGKPEIPIPLHSSHLTGNAVDLYDPEGELKKFLADEKFLTDNGLWSEGFAWTPTWVHVQNIPYGSFEVGRSRFFKP